MPWAAIQPNCIARDHNDVRKFMGHFPQAEYQYPQDPYEVLHLRQIAPAAGNPAETIHQGNWRCAVVKNLSKTDMVDLYVLTSRMNIEAVEAQHLTILPKAILTLCRIYRYTPMEIVSLGAEAEMEIVLIGWLEPRAV